LNDEYRRSLDKILTQAIFAAAQSEFAAMAAQIAAIQKFRRK